MTYVYGSVQCTIWYTIHSSLLLVVCELVAIISFVVLQLVLFSLSCLVFVLMSLLMFSPSPVHASSISNSTTASPSSYTLACPFCLCVSVFDSIFAHLSPVIHNADADPSFDWFFSLEINCLTDRYTVTFGCLSVWISLWSNHRHLPTGQKQTPCLLGLPCLLVQLLIRLLIQLIAI